MALLSGGGDLPPLPLALLQALVVRDLADQAKDVLAELARDQVGGDFLILDGVVEQRGDIDFASWFGSRGRLRWVIEVASLSPTPMNSRLLQHMRPNRARRS